LEKAPYEGGGAWGVDVPKKETGSRGRKLQFFAKDGGVEREEGGEMYQKYPIILFNGGRGWGVNGK